MANAINPWRGLASKIAMALGVIALLAQATSDQPIKAGYQVSRL